MKSEMKNTILDLINSNSICDVSADYVHSIKNVIESSALQNEKPIFIEREKAIEIYTRRAKLLDQKGNRNLGTDELIKALRKADSKVAIVQSSSRDKSLTIFLNEALSIILGVIVLER